MSKEFLDRWSYQVDVGDKRTITFSDTPVAYVDENGLLHEIAPSLQSFGDAYKDTTNALGSTIEPETLDYTVKTDQGLELRFEWLGQYTSWKGKHKSEPQEIVTHEDAGKIIITGVEDNQTNIFETSPGRLKHTIKLISLDAPPDESGHMVEFKYFCQASHPFEIKSWTGVKSSDFTTPKTFLVKTDLDEVRFEEPVMWDAQDYYFPVAYRISDVTESSFTIGFLIDVDEIKSVQFPLYIDPTVSVSGTGSGQQKNWTCDYPHTVSWQCSIHGHSAVYKESRGRFSIYDGAGNEKVYRQAYGNESSKFSGSFGISSAELGTGRIRVYGSGDYAGGNGSVTFQVDTTAPSLYSKSTSGARWTNGGDIWVRPNDVVTIKHRGRDTQSGMKHHYLRAYSGSEDARTCPTSSGQWMTSSHIDLHGGGAPTVSYGGAGWNKEYLEYTYKVKPKTKNYDWTMQGYYTDMKGNNYGYFNLGYTIRVDGDAPTISVSTDSINKKATISASDSRSGLKTLQYVITSSSTTPSSGWASISSGATVSVTGAGTRYIHVRAYDRVDNLRTTYKTLFVEAQIATCKINTSSGILSLPVFKTSDLDDNNLRINTPAGVGAFRLVSTGDSRASNLRIQTPNGVRAIAKS